MHNIYLPLADKLIIFKLREKLKEKDVEIMELKQDLEKAKKSNFDNLMTISAMSSTLLDVREEDKIKELYVR